MFNTNIIVVTISSTLSACYYILTQVTWIRVAKVFDFQSTGCTLSACLITGFSDGSIFGLSIFYRSSSFGVAFLGIAQVVVFQFRVAPLEGSICQFRVSF